MVLSKLIVCSSFSLSLHIFIDTIYAYYRTRDDDDSIHLNRRNDSSVIESDLFCCVVPDAMDNSQTLVYKYW